MLHVRGTTWLKKKKQSLLKLQACVTQTHRALLIVLPAQRDASSTWERSASALLPLLWQIWKKKGFCRQKGDQQ